MSTFGKMLATVLLLTVVTTTTYGAYETVSCDSDTSFSANSCSQCFDWGEAAQGDNRGLLTDIWENTSEDKQLIFKEEQEMPKMVSLGGASWSEIKSDGMDFWKHTSELDALYSEDYLGYTLDAKQSVKWIESTLGSAYQLTSSSTPKGDNVGMIVYDIAVNTIQDNGSLAGDSVNHRECVLIKSGDMTPPVIPETPELPQTGPEHVALLLLALILGFGFFMIRKKA